MFPPDDQHCREEVGGPNKGKYRKEAEEMMEEEEEDTRGERRMREGKEVEEEYIQIMGNMG